MVPRLSVVIASVNGPVILECLEKLEALQEREQMEILVLDRRSDGTAGEIARRFPRVVLHAGLTGKSIPELRWQGMHAARGEFVAVLEDHCLVTPHWAAEILRFADSAYGVVGGPVENASRRRLLDWAFFLSEYGPAMPPLPAGETRSVPGNNAAYRRSALPLEQDRWATLWENFLQAALRRANVRIVMNPAMLVYHKKAFGFGEVIEQRFLYSRSLAAMRGRQMSAPARLARAALSVFLPPVLLWRICLCLARKRRNLTEFVMAFPLIILLLCSWAAGDIVGYMTGTGDSLERVE